MVGLMINSLSRFMMVPDSSLYHRFYDTTSRVIFEMI